MQTPDISDSYGDLTISSPTNINYNFRKTLHVVKKKKDIARGVKFKGCCEIRGFVEIIVGEITIESPYRESEIVRGSNRADSCLFEGLPPDKGRPSLFSTWGFLLPEFLLRESDIPLA